MADLGRINERTVRASSLTRAEFDDLRSTYRETGLWCAECGSPMYPQARSYVGGRLQLFAHWPDAPDSCSAKAGESLTHHDLKHLVASIGEQIGYRAEIEQRFAQHKPDVLLYDPTKSPEYGPKSACEIQQSELDLATFDWRDSRLNSALRRLSTGVYDRRAALWLFTHRPGYAATRAHVELRQKLDDTWHSVGGVYTDTALEQTLDADLAKVMTGIKDGDIVRLQESIAGAPVSYWTTTMAPSSTRAKARLRETSDLVSAPCSRPPAKPKRSAFTGGHPICTVCGNPIMWTTGRTTHVVCEAK